MLKTLYDIQTEYATLVAELLDADGELTEEMEFALAINKDELEAKAEGYALRILDFDGQAELIQYEIERLTGRKKQYENTAKKLKETIHAAMVQFQVDKIKTQKVTLSFRKSEVCEVPETFADDVLQFVSIKAEIDPGKVKSITEAATAAGFDAPKVPGVEMLDYFKLSAAVDKAKIKATIKEGTTVGDAMVIERKNLQIK